MKMSSALNALTGTRRTAACSRLIPSESRGALWHTGMLLATQSNTGQLLAAKHSLDVGLTFFLCTGREQYQPKAVGQWGEVEVRSNSAPGVADKTESSSLWQKTPLRCRKHLLPPCYNACEWCWGNSRAGCPPVRAQKVRLCKEGSACLSYPHATGLQPWWGSLTSTATQQQSMKPLSRGRCPWADMLSKQGKAIIILPAWANGLQQLFQSTHTAGWGCWGCRNHCRILCFSWVNCALESICCESAGERVAAVLLPTTLWLCPEFLWNPI